MVDNVLVNVFYFLCLMIDFWIIFKKKTLKRKGKYARDSQGVFAEGKFCCAN